VSDTIADRAERTKIVKRVSATIPALDDVIGDEPAASSSIGRCAVRHGALVAVALKALPTHSRLHATDW
jgi:hypothetical protein